MSVINLSSRLGLGLGIALALGACSDSGDGDADGDTGATVQVSPAVAQSALTELTTNVDTSVTGFRAEPVPGAAPGGAGTIEVQCASGGGASVNGRVNIVPLPVMVDVDVTIGFDACTTSTGTILAGDIDFSQSVVAGALPVEVMTSYQGNVVFTGAVQARCDVSLNVRVDETGRAVQVTGSFCGQDASQMNLQIMPRWRG